MKHLNKTEFDIEAMKINVVSALRDIPQWRDAVTKLLEDWQTMYPLYRAFQLIDYTVKR